MNLLQFSFITPINTKIDESENIISISPLSRIDDSQSIGCFFPLIELHPYTCYCLHLEGRILDDLKGRILDDLKGKILDDLKDKCRYNNVEVYFETASNNYKDTKFNSSDNDTSANSRDTNEKNKFNDEKGKSKNENVDSKDESVDSRNDKVKNSKGNKATKFNNKINTKIDTKDVNIKKRKKEELKQVIESELKQVIESELKQTNKICQRKNIT